jgi:hypothetical protein
MALTFFFSVAFMGLAAAIHVALGGSELRSGFPGWWTARRGVRLVLHAAVNAWSLVIPVMVLPDGSNLRPFQLVVGILVLAALLLLRRDPTPKVGSDTPQSRP